MIHINRRQFLTRTAAGLAGINASYAWRQAALAEAGERPPNIVVFMADDMGAKELSCYGHTTHKTPNLNTLAETGVRFETCYSTPICHPTRFEIMTGQYGCHNGIFNFANRRGGPEPDSPVEDIGANHVTFAEVLKQRDYATGLAGKWQLSGELPTRIYECGFDEYCIWAYRNYLPEGVEHTGGWEKPDKPSRYWHPCIMKNGQYVPTKSDDYGPDIYTNFAIDFIRRHKDQPFFFYYPMTLTHGPYLPTPDNVGPEADRYKHRPENFKDCVEYTDKLVGRVVAALDELGLRDKTVVFFTGDNGTGGEGKGEPTELGARVPMIVNGPGIVRTRGATDELTDLSDILPTVAELAGAGLPEGKVIDGRSYAGFLRGETDATREWIFSYIADRRILRTKRWLLEDNSPLHYGRLYDCGENRNGAGYTDVTDSEEDEVVAVKKRFDERLKDLPAPHIPEPGPPAAPKSDQRRRPRRR